MWVERSRLRFTDAMLAVARLNNNEYTFIKNEILVHIFQQKNYKILQQNRLLQIAKGFDHQ